MNHLKNICSAIYQSYRWGLFLVTSCFCLYVSGHNDSSMRLHTEQLNSDARHLDYTLKDPEQPPPNNTKNETIKIKRSPNNAPDKYSMTVVVGMLLCLMLGLIIWSLRSKSKKAPPENIATFTTTFTPKNQEELLSLNTSAMIRSAELKENWEEALRLRFLDILSLLVTKGLIRYKKDVTNREYLNMMSSHAVAPRFREVTHLFDVYWYGEKKLTRDMYQQALIPFEALYQEMKGGQPS
jgi:hypothetical protein